MINKPYYRIYRPFYKNATPNQYDYLNDKRNCDYKPELIRYYRILENEVKMIMEYVDPSIDNMKTYSLRIYQILTSICIEIENNFKGILSANCIDKKENMCDYYQVNKFLKLDQYEVEIIGTKDELYLKPFENWHDEYKPLNWYQSYNGVKHYRTNNLKDANLKNLLEAISALSILLYAQFGMYNDCISESNVTMYEVFSDDGSSELIVQKSLESMVQIKKKPYWKNEEKYDFDWENIKSEEDVFEYVKI